MPAKNLVPLILENYKASNPNLDPAADSALEAFVQFANDWVRKAGFIGVGYTPAGLTMRTKDGQEIVLDDSLAVSANYPTGYNAVGITGYTSVPSVTTPPKPVDVSVTGRIG